MQLLHENIADKVNTFSGYYNNDELIKYDLSSKIYILINS